MFTHSFDCKVTQVTKWNYVNYIEWNGVVTVSDFQLTKPHNVYENV